MDPVVTLYRYKNSDISVTIEAGFEDERLIIDGYDIGSKVAAYWGDSDYEYTTTLQPASVAALYVLLGLESGDKQSLLESIAARFNTDRCYSQIQEWLEKNNIAFEGFSWI